MDPNSINPPEKSTCTSCIYTEDASNYWTASIYFRSPENGTFKRVPQKANGRLNGTLLPQEGGLTVYYMRPFSGNNKKTTVFKPVSKFRLKSTRGSHLKRGSGCSQATHRFARRKAWRQASAIGASRRMKLPWAVMVLHVTLMTQLSSRHNRVQGGFAPPSSSPPAGTVSILIAQITRAMWRMHRVLLHWRATNVLVHILCGSRKSCMKSCSIHHSS